MNKEQQIDECKRNFMIDELTKMPPMVVATAYLYAVNYNRYGENVTEKWLTALQQSNALEKAYRDGYYDAIQRMREERLRYEKESFENPEEANIEGSKIK